MTSHLAVTTSEMFAALEIEAVLVPSPTAPAGTSEGARAFAATIGYLGEGIRGALTLVADEPTVTSWLPRYCTQKADASDAIGEFANMALGRLKTRVLRDGLSFGLSTPKVAPVHLGHVVERDAASWLAFAAKGRRFWMKLDIELEPGFEPQAPPLEAPVEAGEALLF
ncbi:MAG TPA: chemotaxis protein CheX [Polyangiaceae bacterium]